MQTEAAIDFRPFGPEHLPGAAALSQAERWPHRIGDWEMALGLGHGVVVLADGAVAGTAMVMPFGSVATAGMIIVGEALRGKGVGRRLMAEVMALAAPREWRLVATTDGLPLYRKLGFDETGEVVQIQGLLSGVPTSSYARIGRAEAGDAARIAAIDTEATGMARLPLVEALLKRGPVAVLRDGGRITGYAALRPFGRGEVAGPVIAAAPQGAQALLAFLLADRAGRFVRVDTDSDSGLIPWLEQAGLVRAGKGVAMRRQDGPAVERPATSLRRFALAAQALG